jgi:hypothetical protein
LARESWDDDCEEDPVMYIEDKSEGLNGPARIGRVTLSKSGQSIHYGGRTFQRLGGAGFKASYFDVETG